MILRLERERDKKRGDFKSRAKTFSYLLTSTTTTNECTHIIDIFPRFVFLSVRSLRRKIEILRFLRERERERVEIFIILINSIIQ